MISNIALEECGWTVHQLPMLKDCVKLLCTQKTSPNDSIAESIINRMKTTTIDLLTVEMSRHPSTSVRSIVLHLYNVMVDLLPLSDLEKKLLPAVKQLGNDSDLTVKISSLRPLATLCTMIKSDAVCFPLPLLFFLSHSYSRNVKPSADPRDNQHPIRYHSPKKHAFSQPRSMSSFY